MLKFLIPLLLLSTVTIPNVDPAKVRYGNLLSIKWEDNPKVGIVRSKDVYKTIPEYKIILKEDLKQGTARYTHLMQVCTKKYRKSLGRVASGKYELIVEKGGISNYETTDITDIAISNIK